MTWATPDPIPPSSPNPDLTPAAVRARTDWDRIAALAEFKALLAAKASSSCPRRCSSSSTTSRCRVLVGYAPELMATKSVRRVNVAYLFALSQFFMAWMLAWLYVRAAGRFDRMARAVMRQLEAKAALMSTASADVPRLHRGHAGDHLVGCARSSRARARYFAAGRSHHGWQNGIAVAGDYMSAASFLGIAGIIAFQGYDGFMYSVGWLVAYLTVLLIVAEPLRNAGKYTMADVLAYRLSPRPVRAMARAEHADGEHVLHDRADGRRGRARVAAAARTRASRYQTAVIGVGVLMIVYVVFGGMLATTWVQIVKAILLMGGTILLSILVLAHFDFSFARVLRRDRPRDLHERTGQRGHARLPEAGPALQAAVRRARSDLARHGADLRHRRVCRTSWSASTPCPTPDRAHQRGLGDGDHRQRSTS